MKKRLLSIVILSLLTVTLMACSSEESATQKNVTDTKGVTEKLIANQMTPTDIDFSLERYNLIKRAYWVNGKREQAMAVPCDVVRPIGYIALIAGNTVLCTSTVDGKVSSLNSYLSADSDYYEINGGPSTVIHKNQWLADVDGSYGTNVDGIFWFTTDGHYHEWNGEYLYSDVPFEIETPVLKVEEVTE